MRRVSSAATRLRGRRLIGSAGAARYTGECPRTLWLRWPRHAAASVAIAAFGLTSTEPALAWGPTGHKVVALIAEMGLTPAARSKEQDLLGFEGQQHLDAIANWADGYRTEDPSTAKFHFVDVPLSASGYDANRDCGHGCIVSKLEHEIAVLGSDRLDDRRRLEALKWVTHLVADATQPLHVATDGDTGGNETPFLAFGDGTPASPGETLHSAWDSEFLFRADGSNAGVIAVRLARSIGPKEIADASSGSIVDWINEGWRLAGTIAYRAPEARGGVFADPAYEQAAVDTIHRQLVRAGIRLANILNSQLGESPERP